MPDLGWMLYAWCVWLASRGHHMTAREFERAEFRGNRKEVNRSFDAVMTSGAIFLMLPLGVVTILGSRIAVPRHGVAAFGIDVVSVAFTTLPIFLAVTILAGLRIRHAKDHNATVRLSYLYSRGVFRTESAVGVILALLFGAIIAASGALAAIS